MSVVLRVMNLYRNVGLQASASCLKHRKLGLACRPRYGARPFVTLFLTDIALTSWPHLTQIGKEIGFQDPTQGPTFRVASHHIKTSANSATTCVGL